MLEGMQVKLKRDKQRLEKAAGNGVDEKLVTVWMRKGGPYTLEIKASLVRKIVQRAPT